MNLSLLQHLIAEDSARTRVLFRTMKGSIEDKHTALDRNLEGEYVLVHLNTSDDLLVIPEHLKVKSTITLKLSRWFRGATALYEDRIDADLLFDGTYFSCSMPLRAVWGLTAADGQHMVWPESAPPDVIISLLNPQLYAQAKKRQDRSTAGKEKSERMPTKGHLRRVK